LEGQILGQGDAEPTNRVFIERRFVGTASDSIGAE
jgi:hypothetical protein